MGRNRRKSVFREKLLIRKDIEINRAHRVGGKQTGKSRSIVLRCLRYKDKQLIQKMTNKLKNTNINNDYSYETTQIRKELLKTAKELRLQGKVAKVSKDKLITWEIRKETVNEQ